MFYQPGITSHGLPRDPFKACVVPRPIGWISTTSPQGQHNLAPYSQFNNLTFDPPYVMFSANEMGTTPGGQNIRKDSVVNTETTGKFCWNMATYPLREAVNATAEMLPPDVDEFERAHLTKEFSQLIKDVPMVKESPVKFECEYHSTLRLPGNAPFGTVDVVIGKVVGVHIDEKVLNEEGMLDVKKAMPIARCGYYEYAVVKETFEMIIPGSKDILVGLEGNAEGTRALLGGGGVVGKQNQGQEKEKEEEKKQQE